MSNTATAPEVKAEVITVELIVGRSYTKPELSHKPFYKGRVYDYPDTPANRERLMSLKNDAQFKVEFPKSLEEKIQHANDLREQAEKAAIEAKLAAERAQAEADEAAAKAKAEVEALKAQEKAANAAAKKN